MIPIEELEKVLHGCISRTLKRVGRKEFIDLFNYLDKANELNKEQASRIAALEAAIDHLSTLATFDTDVNILFLNSQNPFYIEVMSESGNVKFKGKGKTLFDAINNITALSTEGK